MRLTVADDTCELLLATEPEGVILQLLDKYLDHECRIKLDPQHIRELHHFLTLLIDHALI